MPIGALLAPEIVGLIAPELAGTVAGTALTAGVGAGLGAGTGALFSDITGGSPGKGALSGAIGGAAGPIGGALGEAAGIGSAAGSAIGGAAGGFAGAEVTGGNPLIGAAEGAAPALVGAMGGPSGGPPPSTTVTPMSPAGGGGSAVGAAPPVGTPTASVNPDPTASGSASLPGAVQSYPLSSPTSGGTMDGAGGAMNLSGTDWFASGPGATLAADAPAFAMGGNVGGTATGAGGFMGNLASSAMGLIEKNPGLLLSGGLLGLQAMKGNQPYPAETALTGLATTAGTTGATLSDYMFSGTLPPGAREAVDQATQAAKAETISRYSQLGLGNSTMLSDALHSIDQHAAAQSFQMADQLMKEGANYTALSGQLQQAILQAQTAQDQQFMQALSTFATGLGGLNRPVAGATA